FKIENNIAVYIGTNNDEKDFFSKYTISNFYQTYPSSRVLKSLNMFTFESNSSSLMNELLAKFPTKYLRTEDLTVQIIELLYYPNDYGTTSPNVNLGANLSLKSFDYINVPKAWDYFPQNQIGNVTIGISDGKVVNTDLDFGNKVTYLNVNSFNSNFVCGSEAWHGVSVGAIAAAQGNNAHGISGICSDCKVVSTPYTLSYNGILDLANAGIKVINMSWAYMYQDDRTYLTGYVQSQQDIINQIHDMGVVLVAGAGNNNSYSAPAPNYLWYGYPASYDNVISVSGVNHKNANFTDQITHETNGDVSWYNEDLISPTGIYSNSVFSSFYEGLTTNSKVDICAPAWRYPLYGSYLLGCLENGLPYNYGDGTSGAAPYVTGTVALMQSLNPCLNPNEVEDILQLTSKNIESNPSNSYFIGRIGSGKLESGDSVEFVSELMNPNGNALIDGQDFWRFDFDLQHINNKLTISNQVFRDGNTSNFVAKNSIDVITSSDFKPNFNGFIDLKIDSEITVCPAYPRFSNKNQNERKYEMVNNLVKLYPNPNKGTFTISLNKSISEIDITIFDMLGKLIYQTKTEGKDLELSIPHLPSGLFIVKLNSKELTETLKFIKE
ncbi:S8 family serine peptidase, partial [Flavobacterium sp.]|uniref:S8 family serine peptidase n=1 Tax=Flavobacterium sp. TaxID=239 RepID=UPI0025F7AD5E